MFQLYHTLNSNIQQSDIKKAEKDEIVKFVSSMDSSSREAFFLLIYEHNRLENENYSMYDLPYGGKVIEGNLEFDLGEFPIKLRRILYKFVKVMQQNSSK
jgi:hypothetical protein